MNTSTLFFGIGAICALIGMAWGIEMSATGDHGLAPAHAHLNLVGFALMSVFGAFYALSPRAAASRLAQVHLFLHVAAVAILVPGIVMAITQQGEALAKIGSVLAVLSMLLFCVTVFRVGIPASRSSRP